MIKKIIALFLAMSLVLTGCASEPVKENDTRDEGATVTSEVMQQEEEQPTAEPEKNNQGDDALYSAEQELSQSSNDDSDAEQTDDDSIDVENTGDKADIEFVTMTSEEYVETLSFDGLDDERLLRYVEDNLYSEIVNQINSDEYFVQNVEAVYISKEYVDELTYNSQSNVFFGYTLAELEEQFQGERYIFTLDEDGSTIAVPFENYDDTFDQVIKNVAIGTGVILVCVVISVATAGAGAPAASLIFAASAKTATAMAVSSGVWSGVAAGVAKGIETGDVDEALKAGALAGSEGFKWGAITGAVSGGASEAIALKGATVKGLTMNEAAAIQKESGYPLDVIKEFSSMEQYNICKDAGLVNKMVDGRAMLIRNIDLDYVDSNGLTNLQRMQQGKAAVDPSTGLSYELHHVGQQADSTLAILTKAEHMQGGNDLIWHDKGIETAVHGAGNNWNAEREAIWEAIAKMFAT